MSALDSRQVAKAFDATLRAARLAAGISQEVLAERADCDQTYPSLLERGLRQPTIGMMIDIAGALRLEPATLVDRTIARLHEREFAVRVERSQMAPQRRLISRAAPANSIVSARPRKPGR